MAPVKKSDYFHFLFNRDKKKQDSELMLSCSSNEIQTLIINLCKNGKTYCLFVRLFYSGFTLLSTIFQSYCNGL